MNNKTTQDILDVLQRLESKLDEKLESGSTKRERVTMQLDITRKGKIVIKDKDGRHVIPDKQKELAIEHVTKLIRSTVKELEKENKMNETRKPNMNETRNPDGSWTIRMGDEKYFASITLTKEEYENKEKLNAFLKMLLRMYVQGRSRLDFETVPTKE